MIILTDEEAGPIILKSRGYTKWSPVKKALENLPAGKVLRVEQSDLPNVNLVANRLRLKKTWPQRFTHYRSTPDALYFWWEPRGTDGK